MKEVTEEQRKQNIRDANICVSIVVGIVGAYLCGYLCSLCMGEEMKVTFAVLEMIERLMNFRFFYGIGYALFGSLIGALLGCGLFFLILEPESKRNYAYKEDEIAGTGGFMTKKEIKAYAKTYMGTEPEPILDLDSLRIALKEKEQENISAEKDDSLIEKVKDTEKKTIPRLEYSKNMIISQNFGRPLLDQRLIGNNNVFVVGASGMGKSRSLSKPNILQKNASFVITDPSGELVTSLGTDLKNHGYTIKIFNISDMAHSNCYNPLHYIRNHAGVQMAVDCFISNTEGKGKKGDEFFVNAEKLLYSACICYLIEFCPDESRKNFPSVLSMVNSSSIDENNASLKSPLDNLFESLPHKSLAWKFYKAFKQAAGKTLKSIIISCVTRLQPFMFPEVINLTKTDTLELEKIGKEKTALFIITPSADKTYSFLTSMLYSQFFETTFHVCEQQEANGGSIASDIPIRCIMDEFYTSGTIPNFPGVLSVMRKYNVSATVIMQNTGQLREMYPDPVWESVIGNCSTILFLGTPEENTAKYFSEMLGKKTIRTKSTGNSDGKSKSSSKNYQYTAREVLSTDELKRLKPDECIVYTQTMRPVFDKKYNYMNHPYYSQTGDANPEYIFRYKEMSVYDNASVNVDSIIKAQSEAKRYKKVQEMQKFQSTESIKVQNLNEEINHIHFDETVEKEYYINLLQQTLLKSCTNDSIVIEKVKKALPRFLFNLTEGVSKILNQPVVLFSDTECSDYLVGVGIVKQRFSLEKLIEEEIVIESKVKKEDEVEYILLLIHKELFKDYKERILKKLEEQR